MHIGKTRGLMLVTQLNVSHTSQCQSHVSMLVTCLNVSHITKYSSHSSMLVKLLNVSHIHYQRLALG